MITMKLQTAILFVASIALFAIDPSIQQSNSLSDTNGLSENGNVGDNYDYDNNNNGESYTRQLIQERIQNLRQQVRQMQSQIQSYNQNNNNNNNNSNRNRKQRAVHRLQRVQKQLQLLQQMLKNIEDQDPLDQNMLGLINGMTTQLDAKARESVLEYTHGNGNIIDNQNDRNHNNHNNIQNRRINISDRDSNGGFFERIRKIQRERDQNRNHNNENRDRYQDRERHQDRDWNQNQGQNEHHHHSRGRNHYSHENSQNRISQARSSDSNFGGSSSNLNMDNIPDPSKLTENGNMLDSDKFPNFNFNNRRIISRSSDGNSLNLPDLSGSVNGLTDSLPDLQKLTQNGNLLDTDKLPSINSGRR